MSIKRKKEKSPVAAKIVTITPTLAERYLERNKSNRNIRPRKVDEYARAIIKGHWHLTPQGISLTRDGYLIDGQHRLLAVIKAKKPVDMVVTSGVEQGAQQYMDAGIPRRIADNLKMFHGMANAGRIATVTRALKLLETGVHEGILLDESLDYVKKYQAGIDWYFSGAGAATASGWHSAALIWVHKHGWSYTAELFAEEYRTLEGLTRGSPVLALRRSLEGGRRGGGLTASLSVAMRTLTALMHYEEGDEIKSSQLYTRSTVGYDYFAHEISPPPEKRKRGTCLHRRGCTNMVHATRTNTDLCFIHLMMRVVKK